MLFTRRRVIQDLSLGGMSLGMASCLRSIQAHAIGTEHGLPKRFVFVVKSSGIDKYNLVPNGFENHFVNPDDGKKLGNRGRRQGPLVNASIADQPLPEKLRVLDSFKNRLTIIQSLSGVGFRGDHTKGFGTLSLHDSEKIAVAPTLDCLLGQHLSNGPYPMYGMAMNGRLLETGWKPEDTYCYPNLSAYGPAKPVAFQGSPRKAFLELFGAAVASPEQLEKKLTLNGNLMDFLSKDARRVERQLSGDDKERFALYMESFDSLRKIEEKKAKLTDQVQQHAPQLSDRYDSPLPSARIESHFEIASAALIAGLTNVITLRPDTLGVKYAELGLSNSVHSIGHLQENTASNGWTGHQARMEIEKLHLQQIKRMAEKFDRIPEGDGTMLDNTMIVYMSCSSGDHHCGGHDWPFILLGGMDNKLKMGRYLEYPKYGDKGHRTVGNLYLSLLQAAGVPTKDTFGQMDSNLRDLDLTGPLQEIMTS
ncbi:DUF1552 domain-containing protein [bacterium]|nr:DUF1552 domain-containing protein [Rubripirellula sp.]MDB4338534.1 DUF1552 domain-containing protein [Rubripirellula sp.]MDB4810234.1 DUF1552 domain-containing protein [bacterium]